MEITPQDIAPPKIRFSDFDRALTQEVDKEYFQKYGVSEKGNMELYIKTVFFFLLLGTSYWLAVFAHTLWIVRYIAWGLMGISFCGIGMGFAHDASHDAYSKHEWVNTALSYSFNLIGVDARIWHMKHVVLHHNEPNVDGIDDDPKLWPFFRVFKSDKKYWFHDYQHIYCWILYPVLAFVWVFVLDVNKWWRKKVGETPLKKWTSMDTVVFWTSKVWHVVVYMWLPYHFTGSGWIWGYVLCMGIAGFTLSSVFQCAHLSKGLPVENKGYKKDSRFRIQMRETTNFAPDNKLLGWFIGGLNFQVEHHLFPHISSVHYRKIAPIVKAFTAKYNDMYAEITGKVILYHELPTFRSALYNHGVFLRKAARA